MQEGLVGNGEGRVGSDDGEEQMKCNNENLQFLRRVNANCFDEWAGGRFRKLGYQVSRDAGKV